MLTIDGLKALGVNTQEGLARCLNNEAFYLNLVTKALADDSIDRMEAAIECGDLAAGFEMAHSLKGVLGNLALTPYYNAVAEITELLRGGTQTDYTPYLRNIRKIHQQLFALMEE